MNRFTTAVFVVLVVMSKSASALDIDCDNAFTRVETTVCANPQLDSLNRELKRLSVLAIGQNLASARGIDEMHNAIALSCRGAEDLAECLITRERIEIARLTAQLSSIREVPASYLADKSAERVIALKEKLRSAELVYQRTRDPLPVVVAVLQLLDTYQREARQRPRVTYEIRALEARLHRGCSDFGVRRLWNRALQDHGKSCGEKIRISTHG